jgi:hypothetical protein
MEINLSISIAIKHISLDIKYHAAIFAIFHETIHFTGLKGFMATQKWGGAPLIA